MHKQFVEHLLIVEEARIAAGLAAHDSIQRVERRGERFVVEIGHTIYPADRLGLTGYRVPILGHGRQLSVYVLMQCDNYDTDPASVTLVSDWSAETELPFEQWPKGTGIVDRHHVTGKPFFCRPGTREFHSHFQHGDEPWELFRGRLLLGDLLFGIAADLQNKFVTA